MRALWFYGFMDRLGIRNYRAKLMLVAFIGTHIPLISLVAHLAIKASASRSTLYASLGVTLVATLVGTGITLLVLNHLLRPVLMTSKALRDYRATRARSALPVVFRDEVGTLMADTAHTLEHLEQTLETLSYVDAATSLPNRKKLIIDLLPIMTASKIVAICAVRFVSYSRLRNAFDADAADAAAREIAARLVAGLAGAGNLYRINDTDFAATLTGESFGDLSKAECQARLRAWLRSCEPEFVVRGLMLQPILIAGVAIWPTDGETPEALIDSAAAAIRSTTDEELVCFHSPSLRRAAVEGMRIEQDLRRAIAKDEFVLHYQPVIDLSRGETIGAEALIRWRHPERGLVPPAAFIGVAEETGLIEAIGRWTLRQACRQAREWDAMGLSGVAIAVNLSARQFLDPNLVSHIADAMRDASLGANRIEIELTETAAMVDQEHSRNVFGRLRDLGIGIAIDDFGTGYASMSSLRNLPFGKLKIDREFVAGVHRSREGQAICRSLVALAEGLGIQVVAEGTEAAEEVMCLHEQGCSLYQGYYFSKPLAPQGFIGGLQDVALASLAITRDMIQRASARDVALAG